MTTPLPMRYGKGRSLVDKTRIRWAGVGNLVLGVLLIVFGSLGTKVIGFLFIALGLAVWILSAFGTIPFPTMSPVQKATVAIGSVGLLMVAAILIVWRLGRWIADAISKSAAEGKPKPPA